jgi:hypothetical protein
LKKFVFILLILLVTISIVVTVVGLDKLYLLHSLSTKDNASAYLTNLDSTVQVGYNIVYLILAIVVLLVAFSQLDKTREATTIQTLSNIDNNLKSDAFLRKRKALAEFILRNDFNNLSDWLKKLKAKNKLTLQDETAIAFTKNIFESVIYEFEFIAYYYKKGIFGIEDIYQLFSIEIQLYWILMQKLHFVEYLRSNKLNPRQDYYDKFESLFLDTLIQEIIESNSKWRLFVKIYYRSSLYKFFYKTLRKKNNHISKLTSTIEKTLSGFLIEEKNLID